MASCKDEGVYRHFEAAFVCGVLTVGVVCWECGWMEVDGWCVVVGGWCVMVVEGMVVCDGYDGC